MKAKVKKITIINFAVYIGKIDDETDFFHEKVYPVLKSSKNDPKDYLRVIDETGEDYLFPADDFKIIYVTKESYYDLTRHFEKVLKQYWTSF